MEERERDGEDKELERRLLLGEINRESGKMDDYEGVE